ncbi:MAG: 3-hydroxyacyl-CoA dehydrogenase family protein [Chlorobi bacterium]|nr:3-hydroxyacyl-CoA dehydrogenase family protein [Chlorobiota bacterium]
MSEVVEAIEAYGLSKKDKPKALFSQVGVVGCGTTGQSIVLMIASKGIEVVFLEISEKKIKQVFKELSEAMDKKIDHWGMTESDKRSILSRITGTLKYEDFADCDLVIESILSKVREFSLDIRKNVFKSIEEQVSEHCIIATNSTTIVITELASELKHKERCISLHFSTTAPEARLVEVVKGLYTTSEVCENVNKFTKLIDKIPIPVDESPGLISVRLFISLIGEACEVLMEGVSTMENIDLTMKRGLGMQLGPFEMADKIGIDKIVRWMDNLYREFGDMKYKAPPYMKKLYRANHFGRKTGKGFYEYDEFGNKKGIKI